MSLQQVHVVSTGTANLASVEAALRRSGRSPIHVGEREQILEAERLVVPGVGTLGAARRRLAQDGFFELLRQRIEEGLPTLAICVGMQLLAEGSEESPDEAGLGVLPGSARRFPADVRVPQIGWNRVMPAAPVAGIEGGFAYFANSFYLGQDPGDGWTCFWSEHGVRFLAAAARGRILACQFHPELSGQWGQDLLTWWLQGGVA